MNDTPRTDAAELVEAETRWGVAPRRWPYVPADFARDLERALATAQRERDHWKLAMDAALEAGARLLQDKDALRGRVAELEQALRNLLPPECPEWWCPTCKTALDGRGVTFTEHCATCGTFLPPEQPRDARWVLARALLAPAEKESDRG